MSVEGQGRRALRLPPGRCCSYLPSSEYCRACPRKPQPPQPTKTRWHVYKLAAKRQWVGEIEAVEEREAIKIAAKEFKQPAKKLMAVPRR